MKNKLLLFLLFSFLIGNKLIAKNLEKDKKVIEVDINKNTNRFIWDTIKKSTKKNRTSRKSRTSRISAILPSPIVFAGSSCGDGVTSVQVNLYANGLNNTETIEWFTSQTAVKPVFTGTNFSPSVSKTITYYVQSRLVSDVSIRVPVVASVYVAPPAVTLTASPANNESNPLCVGTPVTFTATGGGDLFEFSVDGVVLQSMSTSKVFTTTTLTDGQVVRVRSRYKVNFDGVISESAWGTAALEDNFLSAPLSVNALGGYINSIKISPTEDKLVFGIAGKIINNRKILLFLDTKSGGFNISNYGDENGSLPLINAFNFFNDNPSTFDSYFTADYCIAISTDVSETTFSADVIELKTGNSIKTFLGNAVTGSPTAVMGVNKNNTGINDYNLGFEVEVLKSLIGYTNGDIKFFALTMQDDDGSNYNVTNSFLSPERTSNLDYGSVAIDYNGIDPNPVVVSSSALTPCYSESSITMNFVEKPTVATVGINQFNCTLTSSSLGGNTPVIGSGKWTLKSGSGTVLFSDANAGSSTATVSVAGSYVFTWTISNGLCDPSSADINVDYEVTPPPIIASVKQPTCSVTTGSVLFSELPSIGTWTITPSVGTAVTGSGTSYEFENLLAETSYFFTVTTENTCVSVPSVQVTINAVPLPPVVPTTISILQPTCLAASGTISIATQTGVEYSLNGTTYQNSNIFSGLTPNSYTLYVRNLADATCLAQSVSVTTINPLPVPPVAPTTSSIVHPTCAIPSGTIIINTQSGVEYSLNGINYQSSNTFSGLAPNSYTLYIRNLGDTTCTIQSASTITINALPIPPVVPTSSSVVQPTCLVPSGTIVINTQTGVEYSLNGTAYQSSNIFSGLTPNTYTLYVRNIADATCAMQSISVTTINAVPLVPNIPMAINVVQPNCTTPSGTITIETQTGVEYSLNGTTYQSSNIFSGLGPNDYTLYVRNIGDATCMVSSASTTKINLLPLVPIVTTTSIVQPTCAIQSGTIVVTLQNGMEYSLDGVTYQASNVFSGLVPNVYLLYVRNTADFSCLAISTSTIKINPIPTPPLIPTLLSVVQPICEKPSGTITINTQVGVEYSLNGINYQASNVFAGLSPNTYTLYVRNSADHTCSAQSSSGIIVDPLPLLPLTPTLLSVNQPTCFEPFGKIVINEQPNVQYSIGGVYQDSNIFENVAPGSYLLSVRFKNSIACVSIGAGQTINPIPVEIQFEISGDCVNKEYILTANPLLNSYNPNAVSYQWKDKDGLTVGTNSNVLNVSNLISSNVVDDIVFPISYTLKITSTDTGCETSSSTTVEAVYCNIQKGISPDGNGLNEYFDLRLMKVEKLEIFNRYGVRVYDQSNYTNQWKGQSNNGEELPDATYYYVIKMDNGQTKTGWIYLIREK